MKTPSWLSEIVVPIMVFALMCFLVAFFFFGDTTKEGTGRSFLQIFSTPRASSSGSEYIGVLSTVSPLSTASKTASSALVTDTTPQSIIVIQPKTSDTIDIPASSDEDTGGTLIESTIPYTPEAESDPVYVRYWRIIPSVDRDAASRGVLMGVVMERVRASIPPAIYPERRAISLRAAGASSIAFTIDGSNPTCARGHRESVYVPTAKVRIRAVACYDSDRLAGPETELVYTISEE